MCVSEAQIIIIKQKHCSAEHLYLIIQILSEIIIHMCYTNTHTPINQKAFTISFRVLKAYGDIILPGIKYYSSNTSNNKQIHFPINFSRIKYADRKKKSLYAQHGM